ncbi:hypothetical protein [Meiothermus ruber]|uniref:hypothetical protein n=1 Tax=Meiothermus ruber TaxID=277 RepID=UPI00055EC736|nr:hypothetical protein [Meiothermus ruber]
MAKAQALRELYAALEAYQPLVDLTGHRRGASTLSSGARIVGDSVRLRPHPVPGVVLRLGSKNAGRGGPSQPEKVWLVTVLIYAEDVFQAADILEALETWTAEARWTSQHIRRVAWRSSEQVELEPGQQYISVAATLEITYI